MKQEILVGQTDHTVLVLIRDVAGAPKTGLTEASIDIAHTRVETDNDVVCTDVTPAALSALTDAHTDWGFKEVSATDAPGLYRLDVGDAALTFGAWAVVVSIVGSGLDPCWIEFVLVSVDMRDGVRAGLTALPNAAAEAAGGLYTRGTGAGQINQPANGSVDANAVALNGGTAAAENLRRSAESIYYGSVTGAVTTTTLIDSGLTQADTDHWKGRIVIFLTGTLAKEATDITEFDPATDKLTFTALTSAPSGGDTS